MKEQKPTFPYEKYINMELWKTIDDAINDLALNNDIVEKTPRRYITGYLCEKICKNKNLKDLSRDL